MWLVILDFLTGRRGSKWPMGGTTAARGGREHGPPTHSSPLFLSLSLRVRACERACVRESSAHRRPALRSADTLRGESASRVRVTGLYVDTKGGGARRSMGTL